MITDRNPNGLFKLSVDIYFVAVYTYNFKSPAFVRQTTDVATVLKVSFRYLLYNYYTSVIVIKCGKLNAEFCLRPFLYRNTNTNK